MVWEAFVSPSKFVARLPTYLASETLVRYNMNPVRSMILTRVSVGMVPEASHSFFQASLCIVSRVVATPAHSLNAFSPTGGLKSQLQVTQSLRPQQIQLRLWSRLHVLETLTQINRGLSARIF